MPLLRAGDVYFKPNHEFRDGTIKDKLLVLINTPKAGMPLLGCLTTSQTRHRPNASNYCNPPYGIFAIPERTSNFTKVTHILFDNDENCLPFSQEGFQAMIADGRVRFNFSLPGKMTNELVACIRRNTEFLPGYYYEML